MAMCLVSAVGFKGNQTCCAFLLFGVEAGVILDLFFLFFFLSSFLPSFLSVFLSSSLSLALFLLARPPETRARGRRRGRAWAPPPPGTPAASVFTAK